MVEPHTTAVAVAGGTTAAVVGAVLGVSYDVMFWAILGALAGLKLTDSSDSIPKLIGSVASAAVIGAMISPIATVWAIDSMPSLGVRFAGDSLRPWVAGVVAAFGPLLIPKAIDGLGTFFNRMAGGSPKP